MSIPSEHRRERRRNLLARVDVQWKGEQGESCAQRGMLEDFSPGGVCLRLRSPLPVGTRVHISGYREAIEGTIRYCRRSGVDHLMGVRRG